MKKYNFPVIVTCRKREVWAGIVWTLSRNAAHLLGLAKAYETGVHFGPDVEINVGKASKSIDTEIQG